MRVMLIVRISLALKKKFNKSLVPLWIEIFHSNLLSLNLFVQINTQNRHLFAKSNTRSLLVMARWLNAFFSFDAYISRNTLSSRPSLLKRL